MALSQPAAASAPAVTREASALDTSRVVIAHDTGVLVLNSRTLATLDTFRTLARPALSPAGDGRHVFLTPAGTGTVRILDAGDPTKRGAERRPGLEPGMLNGLQPAHVNSEHGRTAVFDDGTGVIQSSLTTSSVAAPSRCGRSHPSRPTTVWLSHSPRGTSSAFRRRRPPCGSEWPG